MVTLRRDPIEADVHRADSEVVCAGSNRPLILDGLKAVCPGCHRVVKLRLVGGAWRFIEHVEN